jgi:hypothetical protein
VESLRVYLLISVNVTARLCMAGSALLHSRDALANPAGAQETGSPEQISGVSWRDTSQADGGFTAVDNDQVAHPGTTVHYSSSQGLGGFTRRTLDNTNSLIASDGVGLVVNGAGGKTLKILVSSKTAGTQTYRFDSTIQFTQPFLLNSVNPARMLIGTSFLYESMDNGDTLTALGGLTDLNSNGVDDDLDGVVDDGDEFTARLGVDGNPVDIGPITEEDEGDGEEEEPGIPVGGVTAMVYGGRSGGVDNADLIYVASGATLRLRTANTTNTLADFTTLNAYPGGGIRDIEIDPDDWHRGYVVDFAGQVFRFVNNGAAAGDWTNITGNLNTLVTDVRDVELFTPTTAAGDDVILLSGAGGVYRTLNPGPGATWTEFGGNIPNVIATDLVYDAADDVLVVGTYGRGAWTLANASTAILAPGVLQITGDTDFSGEDDTIKLVREANNPLLLDVFLNSAVPTLTVQLSDLQQINVDGLGGHDTLIVDSSNGLVNVPFGIRYDGGTGTSDQLQLVQTGGPMRSGDIYDVGPLIGSGTSTIFGPGQAGTQTVFFENLSPVLDLVPSALLTINATAADNAIDYAGIFGLGIVTIDEQESIAFANKTTLIINSGAGQDTISLTNPSFSPLGLTDILVNGGNPGTGDVLNITGVGDAVTVNTSTSTITGAGTGVSIAYSGIENLNLPSGIGDLTLVTTGADDTVVVTPGLSTGANSGSVSSSGTVPQIRFVNSGSLTANLMGGNDALVVNGSSNADTIAVGGAAVAISGRRTVSYSGVEGLTVNGNAGSDTFNVTPSGAVSMFIDGGDPIGVLPGDLLNIISGANTVVFNAGPQTDEGSFVVGSNQPVSFDHIESFSVTGTGPATINGTNGPDTITVIARDGSYNAAANGVQDFTVSVNTGPDLLFVDVPSLTINALSGSDQITLQTPAPNPAGPWDVDVTINGGPPAADTDRVIVQTPGLPRT